MNTILFEQVTKNYGKVQGISNVTLSIEPGVTGILGPNGAGKSTTMKVLLGLSRPSIGAVAVNGVDPFDNLELRKKIGFVPEYDCFYEHMSAVEYVSYFLMIHDFDYNDAINRMSAKYAYTIPYLRMVNIKYPMDMLDFINVKYREDFSKSDLMKWTTIKNNTIIINKDKLINFDVEIL